MVSQSTNWRSVSDGARARGSALRLRDLRGPLFDYDAPRRRLALCYWSSAEGRWVIERGGGSHQWSELHVVGELLFGPSPWRRSCVVPVFGRLGSVEATVAALPAPSDAFAYEFGFEPDPDGRIGSVRAKYARDVWAVLEAAYFADGGS